MVRRAKWVTPGTKIGVLAVGTALLATACGGSGGGGDADTSAGADQLVIGMTSDPDTLFPWKATQFQAVKVVELMYSTLTELDADLEVVPGVAESWDVSEDGLTVTFTLRDGVTFADGSSLDSADVKSSLERIKDEATGAVAASTLASVEGVEAPDATTVVLTLSGPDAAILAGLASTNLAIISTEGSEETLTTDPNGSGAFTFDERDPSQSLTLAANESYFGGAPKLDSIEFRVIPDETSIVSALQSGSIHFATLDDPLVAQSAEAAGVTVQKTTELAYHALQLHAQRAPFDDLNVRLAVQCAIDRQEVLDSAALGEGEITGPITSPAYLSDPTERPCAERDVDAARQYLDEAGLPDGFAFDAIVSQGEYSTSVNEAQSIQAQLADAGITMNIQTLESGAFVDAWVGAEFQAAVALNGGRPDPDTMYGRYFTSTGNLNQVAGYSSPALDALFAEGKATGDPEERKEIYAELSAELEQNAAWVWLFTGYNYTATTPEVSGFTPMPNESLQYLRETSLG